MQIITSSTKANSLQECRTYLLLTLVKIMNHKAIQPSSKIKNYPIYHLSIPGIFIMWPFHNFHKTLYTNSLYVYI